MGTRILGMITAAQIACTRPAGHLALTLPALRSGLPLPHVWERGIEGEGNRQAITNGGASVVHKPADTAPEYECLDRLKNTNNPLIMLVNSADRGIPRECHPHRAEKRRGVQWAQSRRAIYSLD